MIKNFMTLCYQMQQRAIKNIEESVLIEKKRKEKGYHTWLLQCSTPPTVAS